MWVHKLFFFYILPLYLKFLGGENSAKASIVITTDSIKDLLDTLANTTYVSEISQETEISDNSIQLSQTTPGVVLKKLPHRIVNGTKAVLGQFPQQVSLRRRYSQSHFCGGSIISSGWILTAGHCMLDLNSNKVLEPYTIIVVAGEIVLKNINYARQWSYVRRIIVHPKFDIEVLQNDVALLELKTPFSIDMYVKPAALTRKYVWPTTICQVSGWGYQKFDETIVSSYLLYVDIPLMARSLCRKLLANFTSVPPGTLCAGYLEGGRDACQGDSGGGMLCKGFLTGVVSGGEGCAWPRLPGLYADVKFYVPWIKRYVDLTENFVNANPIRRVSSSTSSSSSSFYSSSALSSPLFRLLVALLYVFYTCFTFLSTLPTE